MGSCKVNTTWNRVFTTVPSQWIYVLLKPPPPSNLTCTIRIADSAQCMKHSEPRVVKSSQTPRLAFFGVEAPISSFGC